MHDRRADLEDWYMPSIAGAPEVDYDRACDPTIIRVINKPTGEMLDYNRRRRIGADLCPC